MNSNKPYSLPGSIGHADAKINGEIRLQSHTDQVVLGPSLGHEDRSISSAKRTPHAPVAGNAHLPRVDNPQNGAVLMSETALQRITRSLHTTYDRIYRERMSDMPIINPAVQVRTIGFQLWQGHIIGILITPWCMNLMCLPGEHEDWSGYRDLTKVSREFPAGTYEFINSSDATIGKYQMCSLFSPMYEFVSDDMAVETAQIILRELMNPQHNLQPLNATPLNINQQGLDKQTKNPAISKSTASPEQGKAQQQSVNRRQLLRGVFQLDREIK